MDINIYVYIFVYLRIFLLKGRDKNKVVSWMLGIF